MRKIIAALITSIVITGMSWADELVINEDVPDRYVVVKGDTLWDIADMYLQDPWKWQDIWYLNPQVENPHLIYPGDIIGLITVDGQTRLTRLTQGENANTLKINTGQADENGVVKLRPTARITPIFGAIPAIAREHIEGFLSGNRILSTQELNSAPYIISGTEGRVIMGAGDTVFGRGEFSSPLPVYQIYRMGKRYKDPFTKEGIGFEAIELGQARIQDLESDIATFLIERSNQQIGISDRILPSDETTLDTFFYPSEPPKDLVGAIVDVARGVKFIGQFDIILLNVGEREGVETGNIFRVSRFGDKVRDPINNQKIQLPLEDGGLAMVFRVFEKMSYALVLESKIPMRIGDRVTNPGF
jgi:hypothetical protein